MIHALCIELIEMFLNLNKYRKNMVEPDDDLACINVILTRLHERIKKNKVKST